jgi:hypothetical protein
VKKGQAHNIRYSIWRNSDDALLIIDATTEQCCNIVGITPKTLWNLASAGGSDKYTIQKTFISNEDKQIGNFYEEKDRCDSQLGKKTAFFQKR